MARTHTQLAASRDPVRIAQRFWAKVDKAGPVLRPELGPCWVWVGCRKTTGSRTSLGYGEMRLFGRVRLAHRVAWLVAHGVMPTLWVLHKCDGGPHGCVRPDHLFEGTPAVNSRDMATKGRARPSMLRGEAHGSAKMTERDVRAARIAFAEGETIAAISRRIGHSYSAIWHAVRGVNWKHVS